MMHASGAGVHAAEADGEPVVTREEYLGVRRSFDRRERYDPGD